MIRIVLAQEGALLRRALAQLITTQDDLNIVADVGHRNEVVPTVVRELPDVIVLDVELPGEGSIQELCAALIAAAPDSRILVILKRSLPTLSGAALARMVPKVGVLATDVSPTLFVESLRQLYRGQPVLDVDIAIAALSVHTTPFTNREQEVLILAAEGLPTKDIAARLFLTCGTVRNYLTRITTKTGARSLIEAVRRAHEMGWV